MEIKIPYYEDNSRISNSSLTWFCDSPRFFKDVLDGKKKLESNSAMKNGTMVHCYILQPEEFKENYKILDFEKPSSPQQKLFCELYIKSKQKSANLKAAEAFIGSYKAIGPELEQNVTKGLEIALKLKSYIKFLRNQEKEIEIISWSQLSQLKEIKQNIILHKKANELLNKLNQSSTFETFNEFHINWEYIRGDTKILCKSLIDRLAIDHKNKKIILMDIKTTGSFKEFSESFKKREYARQLAYYWMAIAWYFENELKLNIEEYSKESYIIAIQNIDGQCKVFRIDKTTLSPEFNKINNIISQIFWHFQNNLWDFSKEYYEGDGTEDLTYDN